MRSESPPLSVLAARAQLGDRAALEALLRTLSPPLRTHIGYLLRDDADADDVLQDTLWLIARRLGGLHDVALVRAWSYRIASREAYRALRRSRRVQSKPLDEEALATPSAESESLDEPALTRDDQMRVIDALAQLPPKTQTVVRLRYLDALSQQKIAAALEIPIGTVKSRLAYGLDRLREIIGRRSAT